MIKLIYEVPEHHKKYTATERIEMTLSCEDSLSSVLDSVKDFLKAVGFGYIEELDYTTKPDSQDNTFDSEDDSGSGHEDDTFRYTYGPGTYNVSFNMTTGKGKVTNIPDTHTVSEEALSSKDEDVLSPLPGVSSDSIKFTK